MGIKLQNTLRALQEAARQSIKVDEDDIARFNELYKKYYDEQEDLSTRDMVFLTNLEIFLANEIDL